MTERSKADTRRMRPLGDRHKCFPRQAIRVSLEELIETDCLRPGQTLPLVIKPRLRGVRLADWVRDNPEFIEDRLNVHGGILFRGFDLDGLASFREVVAATSIELMHYAESATPRT